MRLDKDWNECLDLNGLLQIATDFGGRYARRKVGEAESKEPQKKKRKMTSRKATTTLHHFQPADASAIEVSSSVFGNLEFCIFYLF